MLKSANFNSKQRNQDARLNFTQFRHKVRQILTVDLPTGRSIIKPARSMADDFQIGRTAFMTKMGVDSELEYKKQCIKENRWPN